MSQFIGTSYKASFVGELTRGAYDHTTETKANDGTTPVTAFGVLVKYNANATAVTPVTTSADAILGFSVRKFGQVDNSGAQNESFVTVLKRGYVCITAPSGETITPNSQVYLKANGAITSLANDGATPTPTAYTALAGAKFAGASADGIVEIAYNI